MYCILMHIRVKTSVAPSSHIFNIQYYGYTTYCMALDALYYKTRLRASSTVLFMVRHPRHFHIHRCLSFFSLFLLLLRVLIAEELALCRRSSNNGFLDNKKYIVVKSLASQLAIINNNGYCMVTGATSAISSFAILTKNMPSLVPI